jgi:hypothetical protein
MWIYKENHFEKKFCFWKKTLPDEKSPPAFLLDR